MRKFFFIISISLIALLLLRANTLSFPRQNEEAKANEFGTETSLKIKPAIIELKGPSGGSVSANITIENLGRENRDIKIMLAGFKPSKKWNGDIELLMENQISTNLKNLLQKVSIIENNLSVSNAQKELYEAKHKLGYLGGKNLKNENFIKLAPLTSKNINLYIEIDQDQAQGDYYFTIIFISAPEAEENRNVSYIESGVASNILLFVSNDQSDIEKGSIKVEKYTTSFLYLKGPIYFNLLLENSSDRYIKATGSVIIENLFGKKIDKIEFGPELILAQSKKYIINKINVLDIKTEAEENRIIYNKSNLLGIYNAKLNISSQNVNESSVTFFVIPFKLLLVISIMMYFIIKIYLRISKFRHK